MKRKIIISFVLALATLVGQAQVAPTSQLVGDWSGKLNVFGASLTLVLHLEQYDGYVVALLDSPDQGAKGIGCSKEFLSDDSVAVKVEMINATYRARLKDGNLIGTFTQNGFSFPLTMAPGVQKPNRPQTPQPPFPYPEEEVSFRNDGFTFHGTLTLPEGYSRKTPVLVMVTGSGQQNQSMLSAQGISKESVDAYCEALAKAFDDIAADKPIEEVDDSQVPPLMRANFKTAMEQMRSRYMRDFLKVDVRGALRRVKCPVLALNGKSDTQVNAAINLEAIDKGLTKSRHEVVAYDGLNHLFQHCKTGLVSEYRTIEETISPEVLAKIAEWVNSL